MHTGQHINTPTQNHTHKEDPAKDVVSQDFARIPLSFMQACLHKHAQADKRACSHKCAWTPKKCLLSHMHLLLQTCLPSLSGCAHLLMGEVKWV